MLLFTVSTIYHVNDFFWRSLVSSVSACYHVQCLCFPPFFGGRNIFSF
uniref:Uncharacterized protein n=1 Tax=Arundo donax TaxID=35708 RepID=A0A0A9D3N8_ARUDO